MGRSGRLCPEVAGYPQTEEGVAFWRLIRRAMPWTGGGLAGGLRLDRGEIRARLAGFDAEVIAELGDAYEQSALAAMDEARAAQRQGRDAPAPRRRGRTEESDDG